MKRADTKKCNKTPTKRQALLIENFVDISARKAMEETVKAQRLASIGELAGQLGHDLRNPLAGLKNGVYLLKKKNSKLTDEQRQELLHAIEVAVEDSNRIVSSLIDYSTELSLSLRSIRLRLLLLLYLLKCIFPAKLR